MFTGPVGPVEVVFSGLESHFGAGASSSLLVSNPVGLDFKPRAETF